jgi:hypothetical protein
MDTSKHYALIVGINKYPEFRTLKGAENDANELEKWLIGDLAVPAANITKLVSSAYEFDDVFGAKPVGQQVHDWLNALDAAAAKAGEVDFPIGERVYIAFACHGYNAATAQQTAIMPCTRTDYWDVIPLVPLKTYLQTKAYFKEIVMLSDACRDQIDYAVDPIWPRKPTAHAKAAEVRIFEAYAAKAGQKAIERDFGNGNWRGVMSQAFLQGVRGVAADENGDVWAHKLESHVRFAVVDKLGKEANPAIESPEPPDEPMLICKVAQRHPKVVIDPKTATVGIAILQRKLDHTESPIDLSKGRQEFFLPTGFYSLRLPSGESKDFIAAWEESDVVV